MKIASLGILNPLAFLLLLLIRIPLQLVFGSQLHDDLQRRQSPNLEDAASSPLSFTGLASTTSNPGTSSPPSSVGIPTSTSSDETRRADISSINPPFGNFTTTSSSIDLPPPSSSESTSTVTEVPITTQVTVTHVVTDAFGRQSTSFDVVPTTTMVPSNDPSLANGGESGSSPGVTPQQKKIIIGVVVSIVGILSLVGIAGVIWRIWFSRRESEEGVSLEHKTPNQNSLSRSSIQNNDTVTLASSGSGDHSKKPLFRSMNPSSNF
ncbi:hypothetical protein TWF694_002766 [Orbilia ellipsospora]|uniref:Mid2 domain-containing protein n=1 Tax=Orbilia ellipsospora TaxID=2528407 RepID=A0AAV9X1V1_9PEZI